MEKGRMEEVNSDCMKDLVDKLFPLDLMGVSGGGQNSSIYRLRRTSYGVSD